MRLFTRVLSWLVALPLAAALGWWGAGFAPSPATNNPQPPVYDHQVAYHLASLGVPTQVEEYFMFDLNPDGDSKQQAEQMAKALAKAEKEALPLGITGDDLSHNQAVLRRAISLAGDQTYSNVKLIVVGPESMRVSTQAIVAPLALDFRYFAYP